MHPLLRHDIARYRQADLLREAERERLAHQVSMASDRPGRRFRLWRRSATRALSNPALGN